MVKINQTRAFTTSSRNNIVNRRTRSAASTLLDSLFVMQHYRNIQSPHGIVAGPHTGCVLSSIQQELTGLGPPVIIGAPAETRTRDTRIRNPLLCPFLSYGGAGPRGCLQNKGCLPEAPETRPTCGGRRLQPARI